MEHYIVSRRLSGFQLTGLNSELDHVFAPMHFEVDEVGAIFTSNDEQKQLNWKVNVLVRVL